jgi:tRNA G37 N-methylase TrmD
VPEALVSGDHARIARWRSEEARKRTAVRRRADEDNGRRKAAEEDVRRRADERGDA